MNGHSAAIDVRHSKSRGLAKTALGFALLGAALCLAACGSAEPPLTPTPIPFTGAPSGLLLTPTPAPTPVPPVVIRTITPRLALQTTAEAIDALKQALNAKDASGLVLLLADQVLVTSNANGEGGTILSHSDAGRWLSLRWGATRTLIRTQYVDSLVLLIVDTKDWATASPIKKGTLTFRLHRFNAQGQGDALQGFWEIDTIIYQ